MVPSAAATAPAKVFQMYSPLSIIVQQGQAIRAGKPVDVPPPQQVANGYLRKKDVRLGAPQLFPDKTTYCYSAAWRYEIIAPTNTGSYVQSGGGSSGPSLVDAPTQTMQMATNSATTFDPASASVGVDATITVTGPSQ